jgi:hypothetical protein
MDTQGNIPLIRRATVQFSLEKGSIGIMPGTHHSMETRQR